MKHACRDGLLDSILQETIPMHGRMIHGRRKTGELYEESQAYDAHGRVRSSTVEINSNEVADNFKYIKAVDRAGLNKRLLDSLEEMPNVSLHFNHKLTGADFNKKTAWFEQHYQAPIKDHAQNPTQNSPTKKGQPRASEISVDFDLLIGADGAHSAARYHMMKYARVTYQQEYIDTLWCEFHISPRASSFAISPNHLHIWPGGSFMFIAIPSLDKSFTCTLFAPSSYFSSLAAFPGTDLLPFFQQNFPGICPEIISPDDLQKQFRENPHLPLVSIKCTPYHYNSSVVILGDAAHAMVPFYGQGMNAGLEDVRVLFDFLDAHDVYSPQDPSAQAKARAQALAAYTVFRTPDAHTINDLALRNYEEMRSSVQSPLYKIRKWAEESVNTWFPRLGWSTQYSRVSFENERYSEVERAVQKQGRILIAVLGLGLVGLGGLGSLGLRRSGYTRVAGEWLSRITR